VVYSIFGGKVSIESKRERKLLKRACLNVDSADGLVANPKFPPWSHREISFNRKDQWATIPEPGCFPLILDPYINGVRFEHVLVDGGNSIDILFRNSLPALRLTSEQLKAYDAQFWGILPGQSSVPLGQITLLVQFGTPNHCRTEFVNFVVADFDGTYHAILIPGPQDANREGRPNSQRQYLHHIHFKITGAIDLSIRMAKTIAQATQVPPGQLQLPE